jgi:hypothetical protein
MSSQPLPFRSFWNRGRRREGKQVGQTELGKKGGREPQSKERGASSQAYSLFPKLVLVPPSQDGTVVDEV